MSEISRWDEIQAQLLLAREWGTQLEQLDTAMGVLLSAESTTEADSALNAAAKARHYATTLAQWSGAQWSGDEPFEELVHTAEQLREALGETASMLAATEARGGAKDALHESLIYLCDSVDGFAAYVTALASA